MPARKIKDLHQDLVGLLDGVENEPHRLFVLELLLNLIGWLEPFDFIIKIIEGIDYDTDIVVAPEDAFVGVDELGGKGLAYLIQIAGCVQFSPQQVVEAANSALVGETVLLLEVNDWLCGTILVVIDYGGDRHLIHWEEILIISIVGRMEGLSPAGVARMSGDIGYQIKNSFHRKYDRGR